jgi:hypothetical protein
MRKILELIWGKWNRNISENPKKRLDSPFEKPPVGQISRPSRSIRGAGIPGFLLALQGGPQETRSCYPLRLSPEGGMLACRGRTMANKTKGQDHSGTPPTSRAKAPRRRLKLARASTEREGCRFQGRRSRGWCNDPYITRSTLSTGDEGTYDQGRI